MREQKKFNVDLKWSAWTTDESIWMDYAPSVYTELKALAIGDSITINTAPRKECRYGSVTIERRLRDKYRRDTWRAFGHFTAEWDSPYELMDTLGLNVNDDDAYDAFIDTLPFTEQGEPGVKVTFDIESVDLEWLMIAIDEQEGNLLLEDTEAWSEIEEMYSKEEHGN